MWLSIRALSGIERPVSCLISAASGFLFAALMLVISSRKRGSVSRPAKAVSIRRRLVSQSGPVVVAIKVASPGLACCSQRRGVMPLVTFQM